MLKHHDFLTFKGIKILLTTLMILPKFIAASDLLDSISFIEDEKLKQTFLPARASVASHIPRATRWKKNFTQRKQEARSF